MDLVTLMQCAHWTDQDATVQSVAASLRPNGTMALVFVNPEPTVVGNNTVSALVRRLFSTWVTNILEAAGGQNSELYSRYIPQSKSGLESVKLPEDIFIQEVTKRISINLRGRGKAAYAITGSENRIARSRADLHHKRYAYTSEDPEGKG